MLPFLIFILSSCVYNYQLEAQKKEQARAALKLGEAYMKEKKMAAAFKEFKKSERLNPNNPNLYYAFGNFYFQKNRLKLCIASYKKAIELKHDFSTARNNLGVAYMASGQYDLAISTLKLLLDNYIYATPHFPHFMIGQAYYHKEKYKMALKHFDESLFLNNKYVFALHWKGKTFIELSLIEEAIESLEKAIKSAPTFAEFYLDLAKAYMLAGRKKKALNAYRQVVSIAPDSVLSKKARTAINNLKKSL